MQENELASRQTARKKTNTKQTRHKLMLLVIFKKNLIVHLKSTQWWSYGRWSGFGLQIMYIPQDRMQELISGGSPFLSFVSPSFPFFHPLFSFPSLRHRAAPFTPAETESLGRQNNP